MNPSFYKTIHKQPETNTSKWKLHMIKASKQYAIKLIVSLAVFILLFTSFLMMRTEASETQVAAADSSEQVIMVRTGDTLWGIAKQYKAKGDDLRYVIHSIRERNGLQTADIKVGQQLIIPNT